MTAKSHVEGVYARGIKHRDKDRKRKGDSREQGKKDSKGRVLEHVNSSERRCEAEGTRRQREE